MSKAKKFQVANEAAAKAGATAASIIIEQPKTLMVALEIAGDALLQNNFSQKAIEEMLKKHMGISSQREKKIPSQCVENATIRNINGVICLPPTAIKKAMLTASAGIKVFEKKKKQLMTMLYVKGGSVPITYGSMVPQMDLVRTAGMGRTPDVRFRPRFENWKARLILEFSDTLAVQTVVDLLNRAGSVGVGEWRPEKSGTYGTFRVTRHISSEKEIAEVMAACEPALRPLVIPPWAMDAEMDPKLLKKLAAGASDGDEDNEDETKEE
jgi:hypothetical protein